MILKIIFDRIMAFFGLIFLSPILLIVAVLIKLKVAPIRLSVTLMASLKQLSL